MSKVIPWSIGSVLTAVAFLLLGACSAGAQSVREPDAIDRARALPIERRLDLYQEIYDRPGHPSDSSLSIAFDDEGEGAFRAAVRRMTSVHDFYGMIWIVKAIDRTGGIDACARPNSDLLRERMIALRMSQRDLSYIDFRNCTLASLR